MRRLSIDRGQAGERPGFGQLAGEGSTSRSRGGGRECDTFHMSLPQWRQFQFFTTEVATDPGTDGTSPPEVFRKADITATTSGKGHIVFADNEGTLHLVDRSFRELCAWKALTFADEGRITHLKQMKQRNILVAIAEEDAPAPGSGSSSGHSASVQIWNLDKTLIANSKLASPSTQGLHPVLPTPSSIRTIKIQQPFPVTALAVLDSLTQVAVGFANGIVVLLRGDMTRDRSVKQWVIREGEDPVTGLGFKEQNKSSLLFVTTTSKVIVFNTTTNRDSKTILDDQGCHLQCAVMSEPGQDLVVARDEAIYFYGPDNRGQCFAYEGQKTSIAWYKHYLIITSPVPAPAKHLNTPGMGRRLLGPAPTFVNAELDEFRVSIFDTVNKFIAHTTTFVGGVKALMCEWGCVIVVAGDGKVYRLEEKDSSVKLDMLFKRNLYLLAVNLAHASRYDDAQIAEIFKKYGDHLYSKADYDAAMSQYLLTIGHLEPSYVIRKYLDAQRIRALTAYLQKLHEAGLANTDHTTLLLNCYTKLKDVARLDSFIKAEESSQDNSIAASPSTSTNAQRPAASMPSFDVETAIRVCRQAGYHSHALYLAKRYLQHEMYLRIQVEDEMDYEGALSYLRELGSLEASKGIQRYGKTLLTHAPLQTTDLLVDLCTGGLVDEREFSASALRSRQRTRPPSIRTFTPLFIDLQHWLEIFIERVSEKRWGRMPGSAVAKDRTTLKPASMKSGTTGSTIEDGVEDEAELEERRFAWMTLLELYLTTLPAPNSAENGTADTGKKNKREAENEARRRRDKAFWILRDEQTPLDSSQALLLCHLAKYEDGARYLQEKTGMYADVVRGWMDRGDSAKVVETIEKYGSLDPTLYTLALPYFNTALSSPNSGSDEENNRLLHRVLDHIDAEGLLPPLQVVQALAGTGDGAAATVGGVKAYIGKRVERERKALEEDRQLIKSYREETEKKRREIEELKTSARIFQVTKCSSCHSPLDLPAVHFLCRHSFHQRCLPLESERECPRCSPENRLVLELMRSQEETAGRHDLFMSLLEDADDGFDVIGEYFGKNVLAFAKLID